VRFSADKEFKSSGTSVVDVHVKYFVSLFAFRGPIYKPQEILVPSGY